MERLGIKLVVAERHGMRRFLYPLEVRIPSLYRKSAGKLALADADGTLIPCHVSSQATENGVQCAFALSMAPLETRELFLCRLHGEKPAVIPDSLRVRSDGATVISRQDRVAFALSATALPVSVVYDGIEHLAGPLTITLNGDPMRPDSNAPPTLLCPANGLHAALTCEGSYGASAAVTTSDLTCCKSWVTVRHTLSDPPPGGVLRFTLPLTVTSEMQTCDFGAGNGAYAKLSAGTIDEVVWETDLSLKNAARYRIRSILAGGEARTDYTGEVRSEGELASRLWLHWNEPGKALGLAITDVAKGCDRIAVHLSSAGVVDVRFTLGETTANPGSFGVCYHFLNAIPPIAAATNPASILNPPHVAVVKRAE